MFTPTNPRKFNIGDRVTDPETGDTGTIVGFESLDNAPGFVQMLHVMIGKEGDNFYAVNFDSSDLDDEAYAESFLELAVEA